MAPIVLSLETMMLEHGAVTLAILCRFKERMGL